MRLGFTGTRELPSTFQLDQMRKVLQFREPAEVHHGMCIGADEHFHVQCVALKIPIIGHPPDNSSKVMPKELWSLCAFIRDPKPYQTRNKDIIIECDELLACPLTEEEIVHSGTWTTVRYARHKRRPITIITPTKIYQELPK